MNKKENNRLILKEFRRSLQDVLEPHHDDQFLLRFLKARDYDPIKAEKMIRESFKFRKKIGANTILTSDYEIPEVYRKHSCTATVGYDHEHSTVRIFLAGHCDYKGFVYSMRIVDIMKLLIYFLESDLKMLQERKQKYENVEMKTTFVLDFKDFSLKLFYDKSVINAGIQVITMYQDNYPETLKAAYLVNVPSYFNWIFNIFKPFLNAATLSKIKIYKTDEWKEELRRVMDPKILPGFLGGDRTDPEGNPQCYDLLSWKSKVDPSYYLKEKSHVSGSEDDPDMKTVVVQQRGAHQVPFHVHLKGSVLRWTFRTKEYNIRFGLFYQKANKKLEEILPIESVDCQLIPEENEFICDRTGTYVLYFDNSYSWLTAKQLSYKAEVQNVQVIETNNN